MNALAQGSINLRDVDLGNEEPRRVGDVSGDGQNRNPPVIHPPGGHLFAQGGFYSGVVLFG
jgi:hypothetical protein